LLDAGQHVFQPQPQRNRGKQLGSAAADITRREERETAGKARVRKG